MARVVTSYHLAHLVDDPRRATVWKAIARHLEPNVPKDSHVLELGAGYCHWINNVRATRRVAVDLWSELPLHAAPGVEALVLDIAEGLESLAHASFDVVLASNLLEHFCPDDCGASCGHCGEAAPAGRPLYPDPAELSVRLALVFR